MVILPEKKQDRLEEDWLNLAVSLLHRELAKYVPIYDTDEQKEIAVALARVGNFDSNLDPQGYCWQNFSRASLALYVWVTKEEQEEQLKLPRETLQETLYFANVGLRLVDRRSGKELAHFMQKSRPQLGVQRLPKEIEAVMQKWVPELLQTMERSLTTYYLTGNLLKEEVSCLRAALRNLEEEGKIRIVESGAGLGGAFLYELDYGDGNQSSLVGLLQGACRRSKLLISFREGKRLLFLYRE